jgi:hypothetical protein
MAGQDAARGAEETGTVESGASPGARRPGITRRTAVGAAVAVGAAAALPASSSASIAEGRAGGGLARRFADPRAEVRPRFRWWWPNGQVDPAEIAREVDQMVDAGFGGAEIADVHRSMKTGLDVVHYGWGGPNWIKAVTAALTQARRRGIRLDITVGPSWPAGVPTITPDDEAASKEVVHGRTLVAAGGTYDGPLPTPYLAPAPGVTRQELLAVQALRINAASSPTARTVILDQDSLIDLTDRVTADERLTWTAPADGQWFVIAYRLRGTGQEPEAGPHTSPTSYVVDHFSVPGSKAVTAFWEQNILTPAFRRLLRDAGGNLFEDSLEFEASTFWTPALLDEFRARKGYELLPWLACVVREKEKLNLAFDPESTRRVLNDYWDVLGQLFDEHHIGVLQPWAHGLGMQFRIQPYGLQTDAMASAAALDISEGESLGFKNLDDYRSLAGGRDMAGKEILSNEAAAFANGAYNTTWNAVLKKLNPIFTAGVNQTVLHGFAYADAPGAAWPGFAAFSPYDGAPGYGEAWGPRQPTWRHAPDVAGYFGRAQSVLRSGTPKLDVAFLRQKGYAGSGFGAAWFSTLGVQQGWSVEFVSPSLLRLPSAVVKDGRLAPDGPDFGLLVFEGDAFSGSATVLPLDTAEKLLAYAKAGLRTILVGDWTNAREYADGPSDAAADARVKDLVNQLLAQPTVTSVPTRGDMPAGIAKLGVAPAVRYSVDTSPVLNHHRVEGAVDWFFFANGSATATPDHDVTLPRTARGTVPFALDPWTGRITPVAVWDEVAGGGARGAGGSGGASRGGVRMRLSLRPGQTAIVALAPKRAFGVLTGGGVHAAASEGELRVARRELVLRSTSAGTFTTTLPGGRTRRTTIGTVPAAQELTRWRLDVEDFRPGATATETTKVRVRIELDGLKPWTEIPELQDSAGVGTYTATVDLGRDWPSGAGALLDLGLVTDTFRVRVNGRELRPIDQLDPVADLGPYLRRGRNTIEVEVATPLWNRLRVSSPAVFGAGKRIAYGLVGPVRLLPYMEAEVGSGTKGSGPGKPSKPGKPGRR